VKGKVLRKEVGEAITSLIVAILLAIVVKILWSSLGLTLVVVEGHSMLPLFQSGDLVLVERVPPTSIHVGDIVVYRGCGGHLIIHRVVSVCNDGGVYCFITWGDNNKIPDTPDMTCSNCPCRLVFRSGYSILWMGVGYKRIIGKVVEVNGYIYKVPYLGALSLLLRG